MDFGKTILTTEMNHSCHFMVAIIKTISKLPFFAVQVQPDLWDSAWAAGRSDLSEGPLGLPQPGEILGRSCNDLTIVDTRFIYIYILNYIYIYVKLHICIYVNM